MTSQPPLAPRRPHQRTVHGDVVDDPYAWMRDTSDPDLLGYLAQENAFTAAVTADQQPARQSIYDDISARTRQTDLTVPEFTRHSDGRAWWYYLRTTEGLDYASYHRMPAGGPDALPDLDHPEGEETLLDANALAAGEAYFALGALEVSPDGNRLAYSVDTSGDERYRATFLDLRTRQPLPDDLGEIAAGGCWCGDDQFVYLTMDEAWRPDTCWRHTLGGGAVELLHEDDERFWLGAAESRDRKWVSIALASKTSSETWLLPAGDPDAVPQVVAARRPEVEYDVEVGSDRLYIVHNDGAPDFALAWAPLDSHSAQDWQELRAGEPGVRLLGVSAYDTALVLSIRKDGLGRVLVHRRGPDGRLAPAVELAFDEPLFTVEADGGEDPDTDRLRLGYQSMVTPDTVLDYLLETGERRVLRQRPVLDHPVLGAYRPSDYVQRREWATAPDGTRVPISLVFRRDTPLDGTAGCLLYGYGAYEVSVAPSFSIARLSLLDRGYVYALAHVRGGGELGRSWYEQGRLEAKQNSFSDFIACARHLVAAGYTSPERLAAEGGSAGGLLLGAVLNQAPEAFAAAHAAVPFVDALTTILDPSLPLTVTEWEEWGDPLHDAAAYRRMKAYTPYENLPADGLPALLVTTSLNDTRVEVTEPAKWVARLRHDTGAGQQVLLRTELVAGHGGASGRYASWRDTAFELAWLVAATGGPVDVLPLLP